MEKICKRCKEILSTDKFYIQKRKLKGGITRNYFGSYCIECKKIKRKEHYNKNINYYRQKRQEWAKKNPDRIKELARKHRQKVRLKCLEAYSDKDIMCRCCGEREISFLAIDHIENNGAESKRKGEPKGGVGFFTFLIRNNFPKGFQVLCHNCNMAKSLYGSCPHNKYGKQKKER